MPEASSPRVPVAVIGLGFGLDFHYPAFAACGGFQVVALADTGRGDGRGKLAARGLGDLYRPVAAILADAAVEAVSIAVPPAAQADLVLAALDAGKHVFCEKPLGTSVAQARAMRDLASRRRLANAVDFQFRFNPGFQAARDALRQGAIGEAKRLDVTWFTGGGANPARPFAWRDEAQAGGGVAEAFGCHVMDYVSWLLDDAVTSVFALSRILHPKRPLPDGSMGRVTAEDAIDILMETRAGRVANVKIASGHRHSGEHLVEIRGDDGQLAVRQAVPFTLRDISLTLRNAATPPQGEALPLARSQPDGDTRLHDVSRAVAAFHAAVAGSPPPDLPTFDHALASRRILAATRASLRSGCAAAVAAVEDDAS